MLLVCVRPSQKICLAEMLVQQVSPVLVHLILDDTLRYKAMAFLKIIAEASKSNHHFQYVQQGGVLCGEKFENVMLLAQWMNPRPLFCLLRFGIAAQTNGS